MSFLKDYDLLKIPMEDILSATNIPMEDILSATNNFDINNVIGGGRSGRVYKGELSFPQGPIMVAFKRFDRRLGKKNFPFWKQAMTLSKYKHENLISLMCYCDEGDDMILGYEYASLGSLDRYLSDPSLTWTRRLKICVGVARGLNYLHDPRGEQQRVLHRDIKSENILLDENWMAKISDFGQSKPDSAAKQMAVSNVVGTPCWYSDPLYLETGNLTKESNVYSFGVVLFEVLCGSLCYKYSRGVSKFYFHKWIDCYENKTLDEIIFPGLKEQMDPGSLDAFSDIAYRCVNKAPEERPMMAEVEKELEFVLQQQAIFEDLRKKADFETLIKIAGMSKEVDWEVDEIIILKEDYDLSQLPDSPPCKNLLKLSIQISGFTEIPPTFFEHMPLLEELDLSTTNIQSLPSSISSLTLLQKLTLKDCPVLMELPPEIRMLKKLKLLDCGGSEIMYIPKEIGELNDLEVLRFSLSLYADYFLRTKRVNDSLKVPRNILSKLVKLKELCITTCPAVEWSETEVKEIHDNLCHLEYLETLKWYLPTKMALDQFIQIKREGKKLYESLFNFTLTIGRHPQLTSCLPANLEKKFENFEKCLKWINAEGNEKDISIIMERAEALFLSRHWTIVRLSDFDLAKLKYCLLAECNEMSTLVEVDELPEDLRSIEKVGLESIEYLTVHDMEKFQRIWKGPMGKDSLSRLRILALHRCPMLTTIFTINIAQNLSSLTELTVEECPNVTSLISNESPNISSRPLIPCLEKIFLLDLPELNSIFRGKIILEKVDSLLVYNCLKLQHLTVTELPNIQKIIGEKEWWNYLKCDKSRWHNVFEQLKEERNLIEQLAEATNSLQHFHDTLLRDAKGKKPLDRSSFRVTQTTKGQSSNVPIEKQEDLLSLTLPGPSSYPSRNSWEKSTIRRNRVKVAAKSVARYFPLPDDEKHHHSLSGFGWSDAFSSTSDYDLLKIPLEVILSATSNFDSANVIGGGWFGRVYKGELSLPQGPIMVAFKKLDLGLGQTIIQLWVQALMLSMYKHENLISLMFYCHAGDEMILGYEYASLGSLDRYLSDSSLTWTRRLKICVGAARGLSYLHDLTGEQQRVLRPDIKSGNILLDENWMAKISDFGLSTADTAKQTDTFLVSGFGTPRYHDPDPSFWNTGIVSKESDVYSFGVVLFEVLCGRLCYEYSRGVYKFFGHKWIQCYEKKTLDEIIFPGLKEQMDPGSLEIFSAIAYRCVKKAQEERPMMAEVVKELEFALQQQEIFEDLIKNANLETSIKIADDAVTPLSYVSQDAKDEKPLDRSSLGVSETKRHTSNFPIEIQIGVSLSQPDAKDEKPLDHSSFGMSETKGQSSNFPIGEQEGLSLSQPVNVMEGSINEAPAIGIDFGTDYSCVAVWNGNRVEIIRTDHGKYTTASCVAFLDAGRLIGNDAKNQITTRPANTIYDVKRLIGRKFSDLKVQAAMKLWAFKVIEGPADTPKIVATYNGQEKEFLAEEISSMILGEMKEIAEAYLGKDVKNAVIAVPACFNDSQRQATKDAATIAGLNVIRVINEPTAAAIGYGLDKKSYITGKINVLIFDLGSATLDVSLISIEKGDVFEVKGVAGDAHLGGADFDICMVDHCVREFKKMYGKDLSGNQIALARLKIACENAKKMLSNKTVTSIELVYEGTFFSMKLTRAKFEELNMSLFNTCIETVQKCLSVANMEKSSVDKIFIVGGSTKIRKIQLMLREFFDWKELRQSLNPDMAVAYGAAFMAKKLSNIEGASFRDFSLVDVTPLSLGIDVTGDLFSIVIPRNTPIPTRKGKNYCTTADNQTSMFIQVYQGERSKNHLLGEFRIYGIPLAPKGVPIITVYFDIDVNGILAVTAKIVSTGKSEKLAVTQVNNGRLSKEEIEKMTKDTEKYKCEDLAYKRVNAYIALKDRLYKIKNKIKERDIIKTVSAETLTEIAISVAHTAKWLEDNGQAAPPEEIQRMKANLKLVCAPLSSDRTYYDVDRHQEFLEEKKRFNAREPRDTVEEYYLSS